MNFAGISTPIRESILFVAGLIGLVSYVIIPGLRDPLLLPVYGAMLGMPIVLSQDRKARGENGGDKAGEK